MTNQSVDVSDPDVVITEYNKEIQTEQGKDRNYIEYSCGKICKENNGLQAHQQFCQIND